MGCAWGVEEFELSRWGQGAIGATERIDHWDADRKTEVWYTIVRHGQMMAVAILDQGPCRFV